LPRIVDVLVVEDDEILRTSLTEILRGAGYSVSEARDGLGALESLRSMAVRVMVLDIAMPRLDGLKVLDELGECPPVVVMTAREYDTEIMSRRSKVALYLQKPVPPENLLEAVAQALVPVGGEAGR